MIQIKNLYYKYDDEFILKNINLQIKEGSFTAIIGHNGSGKTTLVKHLNSLLMPTKGYVLVDNLNTKKEPFEVRKKVGMVFQNPEDQLVYSIVEEDIAFGLENLAVPQNEMQKKVKDILKELCIENLEKKNVNMLSAGQKQLVALAGILVMQPKYIVFDEPATTLDPKNKKNIFKIIKRLNKETGIAIILVTNLLEDLKFADRVIVIKNGQIVFDGDKKKLNYSILKGASLDA